MNKKCWPLESYTVGREPNGAANSAANKWPTSGQLADGSEGGAANASVVILKIWPRAPQHMPVQ